MKFWQLGLNFTLGLPGCSGRSQQLQWLRWEAPAPSHIWSWWAPSVLHHRVWILDRLETVDDMGLHHTLIKTQWNFSTDSCPGCCNYKGMLPCMCCCYSNLSYIIPRDAGARCQQDVSRRDRQRLGKLCNIPLGGKCKTGAQSSFMVFLSMNNLWEAFPKSPWAISWTS